MAQVVSARVAGVRFALQQVGEIVDVGEALPHHDRVAHLREAAQLVVLLELEPAEAGLMQDEAALEEPAVIVGLRRDISRELERQAARDEGADRDAGPFGDEVPAIVIAAGVDELVRERCV